MPQHSHAALLLTFAAVMQLLLRAEAVDDANYCTPSESCWPTDAQWDELATALEGKLHVVKAPSEYDACYLQGRDALKLVDANNGLCMQTHDCRVAFCNASFATTKGQEGEDADLPAAVAEVRTSGDIAKVMAFAKSHRIAVSVKTTGHSYMGSSTAKDAITIWTRTLKANDETKMMPTSSWSDTCGNKHEHVLQVGGGAIWKEAYLAAGFNVTAVGGGGLSVSAAGGWLQGCGLSSFVPKYGLGVDNVLSFDVVLTNGTQVVADACSHPDLFWALRGGGGGTFGVVTRVHYRVHAIPKGGLTTVSVSIEHSPMDTTYGLYLSMVDKWIDFIVDESPNLVRHWGGYWSLSGSVALHFMGDHDDPARTAFIDKLKALRDSIEPAVARPLFKIQVLTFDSYLDWRGGKNPSAMATDAGGHERFYIGSWLVPLSYVTDDEGASAKNLLKVIARTGFDMFNYMLGGSATDVAEDATAVHPVFRKAIWQLEVFSPYHMEEIIRSVPNGAAGINHHAKDLTNWRERLWGSNLPRLEKIKRDYDLDNVLNCFHCIGYRGKDPFDQAGVTDADVFDIVASVRIGSVSGATTEMRIGILKGAALSMNGPRFITQDYFDWKPMYSPGNSMIVFFRTDDGDFSKNTRITVVDMSDPSIPRTVSTIGRNWNPTWVRGDANKPDAKKRVVWVRLSPWENPSLKFDDGKAGIQLRMAAYINCASCGGEQERLLSSETVMAKAREALNTQARGVNIFYSVSEWPMSSLSDGRILILRQFEAVDAVLFRKPYKRSELFLLTIPEADVAVNESHYEAINVSPSSWSDGWVHKIFVSSGERFVTYQRNGMEGEDHARSSLCYARLSFDSATKSSVSGENCFVKNDDTNKVQDWYARMTHDERHIVFSSNRPSPLGFEDHVQTAYFRLYAYSLATGDIAQISSSMSWYNYWYPSTLGLTTHRETTTTTTTTTTATTTTTTTMTVTTTPALKASEKTTTTATTTVSKSGSVALFSSTMATLLTAYTLLIV